MNMSRGATAYSTLSRTLGVMACWAWGLAAQAQALDPSCGGLGNAFGPYDYRVEQGQNRKIVEDYHFTARVESLISGVSGSIGSDIDYTLRAFPNHHRALVSMMNLGARVKRDKAPGAQFTVECYFKRALAFRADDLVTRMIYAKYLATADRKPEAVLQLQYVVDKAQDNAFTHYNAGLVYLEMGEFDKAVAQAHRAQSLGFESPRLRQQLQSAGKWVEPAMAAPAASSASAPALSASEPGR